MDRTVQSMLETTPFRSPRQGTLPTPRIVIPSASTSPTTADTFVVPMSRPTTISVVSIRLFMRAPARAGRLPAVTGADADTMAQSWPSLRLCVGVSSHPHHDALGVGVVVEEDHRRGRLAHGDLGQD